ncbi:MAG: DUF2029 domain-containing protein [Planctomycetaceae bacterium]|jgi:hypothetical protein|nr:DUF2029 domain-containing protein [Planctomycetaceae bacterium]MBT6156175.1 DUF2029 domain-containing protein [Planctomycetaceae bacterium]MBT6484669.1 DUF2029 domain-containing protein [Planctomycetaceae bacterium]MBT6493915.1 DUF2029 domain-containing protein [Planctomycetaceae bacterium]
MPDSLKQSPDATCDADAARRRRAVYAFIIATAAALIASAILNARPLQSANDRSRWCTVWSIVERDTYTIDRIIRQPGWDTIDKVRFKGHFYSTKPALLPTAVAGVYWCVKKTTGWNLIKQTEAVTRLILIIVNLLPMIAALVLIAATVERYARRDATRYFVLLTASIGTLLTTFMVTLNNHTVGTVCVVFALYPALRIVIDGSRRPLHFVLAGFFAALTCTSELPAAIFGVSMLLLLQYRAAASTWKYFVPAALLPLAAFFATTYIASGDWRPFYVFFGKGPYNYVYEGIPSYWSNPSGLDANREPWYTYLLHCTVGHHGVLSLSPVFFLTVVGWIQIRRWREHALRPFLWLGLVLTVVVLSFYLSRTGSYNYGGNTSGLRWMIWLIPFWLLAIIPVLDRWADCRWTKMAATGLLAISVFSAAYPQTNPWQHPWLFRLMTHWGWIDYSEKIADFEKPLMTWFPALPDASNEGDDYWIKFVAHEPDGSDRMLRLSDAGRGVIDGRNRRRVGFTHSQIQPAIPLLIVDIDIDAFAAGASPTELTPERQGESPIIELPGSDGFLHGLPTLRKSGYRRGKVRYLKTQLRPDAFRCRHAAGQVDYRPPGGIRTLRYRTELWLCPEVPFGVLKVETTIYDKTTGTLVGRRQMIATDVGKLLPPDEKR